MNSSASWPMWSPYQTLEQFNKKHERHSYKTLSLHALPKIKLSAKEDLMQTTIDDLGNLPEDQKINIFDKLVEIKDWLEKVVQKTPKFINADKCYLALQRLMQIMWGVNSKISKKLKYAFEGSVEEKWELINEFIEVCVETLQGSQPQLCVSTLNDMDDDMPLQMQAMIGVLQECNLKDNSLCLGCVMAQLNQNKHVITCQAYALDLSHDQKLLDKKTTREWEQTILSLSQIVRSESTSIMNTSILDLENWYKSVGFDNNKCRIMVAFISKCIQILRDRVGVDQHGHELPFIEEESLDRPAYGLEHHEHKRPFFTVAKEAAIASTSGFNAMNQVFWTRRGIQMPPKADIFEQFNKTSHRYNTLYDLPIPEHKITVVKKIKEELMQTVIHVLRVLPQDKKNSILHKLVDIKYDLEMFMPERSKLRVDELDDRILAFRSLMEIMSDVDPKIQPKLSAAIQESYEERWKLVDEFIYVCEETLQGSLSKPTLNDMTAMPLQMMAMIGALQDVNLKDNPYCLKRLLSQLEQNKHIIKSCQTYALDFSHHVGSQKLFDKRTTQEWGVTILSLSQIVFLESTLIRDLESWYSDWGFNEIKCKMIVAFISQCIQSLRDRLKVDQPFIEEELMDRPTYGLEHHGHELPFFNDAKEAAMALTTGISTIILKMNNISNKAREYYSYCDHANMSDDDFNLMMVKESCFFIHAVLLYVGVKLACYDTNDSVWGIRHDKKALRMWIESMFLYGNQIPFIVLEEMMRQPFFQDAIKNIKKVYKPEGLLMEIVYKFLLAPSAKFQKPDDLLHGLYNVLILGSKLKPCIIDEGVHNVDKFLCATELKEVLIKLKGCAGMGIRRVRFELNDICKDVIYLPCLFIDESTPFIFKCVKKYEEVKGLYEVSSYVKYLALIVGTNEMEDKKELLLRNVIQGNVEKLQDIVGMFEGVLHLSHVFYNVKLNTDKSLTLLAHKKKVRKLAKFTGKAVVSIGITILSGTLGTSVN